MDDSLIDKLINDEYGAPGATTPVSVTEIPEGPKRELAPVGDATDEQVDILIERNFPQKGVDLERSLVSAKDKDPERQARVFRAARETRLPPSVVDKNLEEIEKQIKPFDVGKVVNEAPATTAYLSNPEYAALSRNEIDPLPRLEAAIKKLTPQFVTEIDEASRLGMYELKAFLGHAANSLGLVSDEDAAEYISGANRQAEEYRKKEPDYAKDFRAMWDKESGDIVRAGGRFMEAYHAAKEVRIVDALKSYYTGLFTTPLELLDAVGKTAMHPRALLYEVTKTATQTAPAIALGVGAAYAAPVVGASATLTGLLAYGLGSFAGQLPTEYGGYIEEELQKKGIDTKDPEALKAALTNAELMAPIRSEAPVKAAVTAGIDTLWTLLFAGKLAAKGAGKKLLSRAGYFSADTAFQSVGETVSEASGKAAAKGGLTEEDIKDSLFEGLVSVGHSVAEVGALSSIRTKGQGGDGGPRPIRVRDVTPPDGGGGGGETLLLTRGDFNENPAKAAIEVKTETEDAVKAHLGALALIEAGKAISEMPVTSQVPEALEEIMRLAAPEGGDLEFSWQDWEAYWQSKGISPVDAADRILHDKGEAYVQALSQNGRVRIPIGVYGSNILPTEHHAGLMPYARIGRMSFLEAKEQLASVPQIMAEIAREAGETPEEAARREAEEASEPIAAELQAAGQPPQGAELFREFLIANGISPEEAEKLFSLNVHDKRFTEEGIPLPTPVDGTINPEIPPAPPSEPEIVTPLVAEGPSIDLVERNDDIEILRERLRQAEARASGAENALDLHAQELATERYERRVSPVSGLRNLVAYEEDKASPDVEAVASIDMDGLKMLNDYAGHAAGSQALYELGGVLLEVEEAHGGAVSFYHTGGDEFVGLFRDGQKAKEIVAEVKARIKAGEIPLEDDYGAPHRYQLKVSAGIGRDLHEADIALYGDKDERLRSGEKEESRGSGRKKPAQLKRVAGPARRTENRESGENVIPENTQPVTDRRGRGPGGSVGSEEARGARPAKEALEIESLLDLPSNSPGANLEIRAAARRYARKFNIPYNRQQNYVKADPGFGKRVADAYEAMAHDPDSAAVRESYDAFTAETMAQYQEVKRLIQIEVIPPGEPNPYKTPRDVLADLMQRHLWLFPTESGFGQGEATDHPLLVKSGEFIGDYELTYNDVFRIVHDYFGHGKEGVGFGPHGEENAWQSHVRMYSPKARPAMTAETRGQNSWVNFGPHGEKNRSATQEGTVYAEQKAGLLPEWVMTENLAENTDISPVITEAIETYEQDEVPLKGEFSVGENVIVKTHGVGVVRGVEERSFKEGEPPTRFYIIGIQDNGSEKKVFVPVGSERITPASSEKVTEAKAVLASGKTLDIDGQTWNRMYRDIMANASSASPNSWALVYNTLNRLAVEKELSFGERSLLASVTQKLEDVGALHKDILEEKRLLEGLEGLPPGKKGEDLIRETLEEIELNRLDRILDSDGPLAEGDVVWLRDYEAQLKNDLNQPSLSEGQFARINTELYDIEQRLAAGQEAKPIVEAIQFETKTLKTSRYGTPSGNVWTMSGVDKATGEKRFAVGADKKEAADQLYAGGLTYEVRVGRDLLDPSRKSMLVVGSSSFLRQRLPFFVGQNFDVFLSFYPHSGETWRVGAVMMSRRHKTEAPIELTLEDKDVNKALQNLMGAITIEAQGEATDSELSEPTIEVPEKLVAWITHAVYRKPKLSLKDVLELKPYGEEETLEQARLEKRPFNVTWEAIPSRSLGLDVTGASKAVKEDFTKEAIQILSEIPGAETLFGLGGFHGETNPNVITQLETATKEEMRALCRRIQYIFKQDAVPYFRAHFDKTEAEKHTPGVRFQLEGDSQEAEFIALLQKEFGPDMGFTFIPKDGQVFVINYPRPDGTLVLSNEEFFRAVERVRENGKGLGLKEDPTAFGAEGEYLEGWGKDGKGSWGNDVRGEGLRGEMDNSGRSVDKEGLDRGRQAFEGLLTGYSGKKLKEKEAKAKSQVKPPETLHQDTPKKGPRGRTVIRGPVFNSEIFSSADESTGAHEIVHFFLKFLEYMVTTGRATPRMKRVYDLMHGAAKALPGQKLTKDQHELLARGFEHWMKKGVAPSAELKPVFNFFRPHLIRIYGEADVMGVEVSPAMEKLFSHLLVSEGEINDIETERGAEPLFPGAMGMTGKRRENYLGAVEGSKNFSREETDKSLAEEREKERSAQYKEEEARIRNEVTEQVSKEPVYAAIELLQKGEVDGAPPTLQGVKLDRDAVRALVDPKIYTRLPRGVTKKGGMDPNVFAEVFGFRSASEMLIQMAAAEKKAALITRLTQSRMKLEFPGLLETGEITNIAREAFHNEHRTQMIWIEWEHILENAPAVAKEIIRRTVRRPTPLPAVRAQAEKVIAGLTLSQIKPHRFLRNETRSRKEAGEALARGDHEAAAKAKEKEAYNSELYRAATNARKDVSQSLEKFKKFSRKDEKLAKSREMNLINAGRAVLSEFGIGVKGGKTAESFLEPIRAYNPDGYRAIHEMVTGLTKDAGHYEAVTYEVFSELKNAVLSLWDLSKSTKEIEIGGKRVQEEEAIEALSLVLSDRTKPKTKAQMEAVKTEWDRAMLHLFGFASALRRVESFSDAMDGGDPHGAFRTYLWNPVAEGAREYRVQRIKYMRKFLEIVSPIKGELTGKEILAPELNYRFENKAELLGAILHTGNLSNFQKLLRGRGWGEWTPSGDLDSSKWQKFVSRAYREGLITKADMDAAQGIWNLMEELKPLLQEAHKEMYGHYFPEVTAHQIVTPFGVYRGGYVPAKADPLLATDQAAMQERDSVLNSDNSFAFPTTGRGATKRRVEEYAAPLQMNLRLIPMHIDWALRFAYIEPRVKQVARLVTNRELRRHFDAYNPTVVSDMLIPWLQRSAQQVVEFPSKGWAGKGLDRVFRTLRRRTGLQIMAANFLNAFQQITGLFPAALKVEKKYLRNALWRYMRSPGEMAAFVSEKSPAMATRQKNQVYDLTRSLEEILLNPSKYDEAKKFFEEHGYFLQSGFQNAVDTITWLGAYEEAITNGETESKAIEIADSAVKLTQGSPLPEDVSRFETGAPLLRAMNMFASYFNTIANLNATEQMKVVRDIGVKKGAGRMFYVYLMGFLMPALIAELIVKMGSGGLDEDDDDQYMDELLSVFFGSQFRMATAMVPILGPTILAGANAFNDKPYDDRISTSPVISLLESAARSPHSLYKAMLEDGSKKRAVKDFLSILGLATGLPVTPIGRPLGYLIDVNEGMANPEGVADFTRGLITGKPGKNSGYR